MSVPEVVVADLSGAPSFLDEIGLLDRTATIREQFFESSLDKVAEFRIHSQGHVRDEPVIALPEGVGPYGRNEHVTRAHVVGMEEQVSQEEEPAGNISRLRNAGELLVQVPLFSGDVAHQVVSRGDANDALARAVRCALVVVLDKQEQRVLMFVRGRIRRDRLLGALVRKPMDRVERLPDRVEIP